MHIYQQAQVSTDIEQYGNAQILETHTPIAVFNSQFHTQGKLNMAVNNRALSSLNCLENLPDSHAMHTTLLKFCLFGTNVFVSVL